MIRLFIGNAGAIALAVLIVSASAGAQNVNAQGVSLFLPTTDLSSGTAQTNGMGGRLVSAGTPGTGIVSSNVAAKVIIEPMNAILADGVPTANFSAVPLTGNAPLEVQFTDLSSGGLYEILSWTWDFGDQSPMSSEHTPKHTYDTPGTYTVTLTILTTGGSASKTRTGYITVEQGIPATNRWGLMALAAALAAAGFVLAKKRFVSEVS